MSDGDIDLALNATNGSERNTLMDVAAERTGSKPMALVETAEQIGGFDNKYLLFDRLLDVVTARATKEIEQRWMGRLAGIDMFAEDHVRPALTCVRWDD